MFVCLHDCCGHQEDGHWPVHVFTPLNTAEASSLRFLVFDTYIAIVGFVVTKSNHSQGTLRPLFYQCWFWVQLIIASPLFAHNMGASTECKYRECSVCTNYYKICKLLDVHQDMRLVLLTNGPYAPVIGGVFAPDWRWSVQCPDYRQTLLVTVVTTTRRTIFLSIVTVTRHLRHVS